jgi:hypothetical protein
LIGGPILDSVTGRHLLMLKHKQVESDRYHDKFFSKPEVRLEEEYNDGLATKNIVEPESCISENFPNCNIPLHGDLASLAAKIPCSSDLVKKKPINQGFVSSICRQCDSPQLGLVSKLDSDDTTRLCDELGMIEKPACKKSHITKSGPNVDRINSNTSEMSISVHGRGTVGLTNQVNPQDLNCKLHHTQGKDLVLDAFVGLNTIGLSETKDVKEPKSKRLAGRRKRLLSKKADCTILADITHVEPQCELCLCRNGGEHCKRQCSQMFILEQKHQIPDRDMKIQFQQIAAANCNSEGKHWIVTV